MFKSGLTVSFDGEKIIEWTSNPIVTQGEVSQIRRRDYEHT